MGKSRILLVDDDQNTTKYIQVTLEMIGYDVSSTASTGAEAVQKAKENKPDLVLIDIALQGEMDGVETAQEINSNLHTPIVYLTDTVNEEVLKRANQTNPYGYVPKPIEAREVRSIIEMALFRHGMETKVKEKERWFSTTLNCIGEGIVTTNTKGNISYMNPVAEKLTGWKHNEAIGTELESVFNLTSEETGDKVELPLTKVITEGFVLSSFSNNIAVKSKEGNTYPIEYTASPIIDNKGRTLGGVITFRDITEKKKVEKAEELRRSEEHFRTLIDNASDLITIIDKDGIIHYQSPSVARILGYSAEESAGTNVIELIHPEDSAKFASMISKLQNTDSTYSMEYRFLHKNQSWRIMEGIGKKLPGSPNEVKIVVNSRDITERKRMEVELAAEKERLSITLRSIGDGVITVDTDGKVVMMNKFAEEFIGWQDQAAFGRPLREIFRLLNEKTREECESPTLSVLETGETTGLKKDTVLITKDGLEKFVSASFAPIKDSNDSITGAVLVFRDITARKRIDEELMKGQKLDSLSVVSHTIANDANNLLSAILGNLSLSRIYEKQAEKACFQIKEITERLLSFSQKDTAPDKKAVALGKLLKDTTYFSSVESKVVCDYDIEQDLHTVEIDQSQFTQVFQNIINNSIDAMPDGGRILVQARNREVTMNHGLPLTEGNYVKVSIIDEGPGISPEQHEHIFDPFFTTKPNGKGLGLAIAYTTIKNHGGYIGLDTKFENGTKIDIYIPESEDMILLEEEVSAESSQEAGLHLTQLTDDEELSEEQRAPFGRKIRVLIMDDERAIREVAGKLLVHHGYEVDFAETGEQALNVYKNFKKLGNTFDIVIMDLNIPEGMGGKETIVKLLELDPDAKAILSTGLTNDPIIDSYTQHGFKGLVTKPYQIEELNNAIKKVFSQN